MSYAETLKTYDKTAGYYAKNFNTPSYWLPQYERFEKMLHGKKIIDVGCGTGRDLLYFMRHGYDVTGIDASAGMLSEARKYAPDGKFLKMNMLRLNFPDASFDGVWCCASLLHIKKEDARKVLLGFNRILKDGGIAFVSLREGEGTAVKECEGGNRLFFANYSMSEFSSLLRSAGFAVSIMTHRGSDGTPWMCAICKKDGLYHERRK